MKGAAHLGGYAMTLSVLCQEFDAWQGELPGPQWLAGGYCSSVCLQSKESAAAVSF